MLRAAAFLTLCLACAAACTQDSPAARVEFFGTVRSADGQPVANAEVVFVAPSKNVWTWLSAAELAERISAPTRSVTTDEAGNYRMQIDPLDNPWLAAGEGVILAKSRNQEFAVLAYKLARGRIDLPLDIKLSERGTTRLRVQDAVGQALPGIDVIPATIGRCDLPGHLAEQFKATSDQQGVVTLPSLGGLLSGVQVSGQEIGRQYLLVSDSPSNDLSGVQQEVKTSDKVSVRNARPRRVRCKTVDSAGDGEIPRITWTLLSFRLVGKLAQVSTQQVTTEGTQPALTGPLTEGTLIAISDADSGHGWFAVETSRELPEADDEIVIDVRRGVRAKGRVISADSGKPLAGISMQNSFTSRNVVTDSTGHFEMWLTNLVDSTYPADPLKEHFYPQAFYARPELGSQPGEVDFKPFELKRSPTALGTVLNDAGQPVAGAQVICEYHQERFINNQKTQTDRQGMYRLLDLAAGTPVKLRVIDRLGVTETPIEYVVGSGPLPTIHLTPPKPKQFRGRLIDDNGRPINGAKVEIQRASRLTDGQYGAADLVFENAFIDQEADSLSNIFTSDSFGWFESHACLDWRHPFALKINHPQYAEKIHWIRNVDQSAPDAAIFDFGDVTLLPLPANQTVHIQVQSPDGSPIDKARVVLLQGNSFGGYGETDAQGQVQFAGKRTTGLMAALHRDSVSFHLLAADETQIRITIDESAQPPAWQPPQIPLNERRAIVRKLLNKFEMARTLDFSQGPDGLMATILAGTVYCNPSSVLQFATTKRAELEKRREATGLALERIIRRDSQMITTLSPLLPPEVRGWLLVMCIEKATETGVRDDLLQQCLNDARKLGGDEGAMCAGRLAGLLAGYGELELAQDIVTEFFETQRQDFLAKDTQRSKRGVARYFYPQLSMVDFDLACQLIQQHAYPSEIEQLQDLALCYAVMAGKTDWAAGLKHLQRTSIANSQAVLVPGVYQTTPLPTEAFVESLRNQLPSLRRQGLLWLYAAVRVPNVDQVARRRMLTRGTQALLSSREPPDSIYSEILAYHLRDLIPKLAEIDIATTRQVIFACMNDLSIFRDGSNEYLAERASLVAEALRGIDPIMSRALVEPFLVDLTWHLQTRGITDPMPLTSAAKTDPQWAVDSAIKLIDGTLRDDLMRQVQTLNAVLDGVE